MSRVIHLGGGKSSGVEKRGWKKCLRFCLTKAVDDIIPAMRKVILLICFIFLGFLPGKNPVLAAAAKATVIPTDMPTREVEASQSAVATPSAVQKVSEKKPDLTVPEPVIQGKLEKYLDENPPRPLNITNFLQYAIRDAVKKGVPANTIVLILLFPIVAALIAASRHLIGLRGLGIFLPAVLSVVFLATGIIVGILLFFVILLMATIARIILRRMKLQYLPRMALLLWFVSLGLLGTLFVSPYLRLEPLTSISIFPILMLILLTEQFIGLQVGKSMREANALTFETIVVALICSLILNLEMLQKMVLIYPEMTVLAVAVFNIFTGRYTGLRLLEYKKFSKLIK